MEVQGDSEGIRDPKQSRMILLIKMNDEARLDACDTNFKANKINNIHITVGTYTPSGKYSIK